LLSIPGLRAIQWVPGPGREELAPWYGLIRRIKEAGKSVEVFARPDEIDALIASVGARGLLIGCNGLSEQEAERLLDQYGD